MHSSTKAWLILIGLTALTALALNLGANRLAPLLWIAALALLTFVKGRLILLDFLELRPAGEWRRAFVAGLAASVALVAIGLAIGAA